MDKFIELHLHDAEGTVFVNAGQVIFMEYILESELVFYTLITGAGNITRRVTETPEEIVALILAP